MRATPSADKKPLLGERWHREAMTERGLIAKHNDSSPLSVAYGDSRPRAPSLACTSQQILDTNHKKIYNKKLSVSQISVRNATCDIELASDSLTNKLDAVH